MLQDAHSSIWDLKLEFVCGALSPINNYVALHNRLQALKDKYADRLMQHSHVSLWK